MQPVFSVPAGDIPALRGIHARGVSQRRGWAAWLVPDVALVTSVFTLFYCLFLFNGYQKLFRDSDSGWHIRTGESIVSTGVLPRTDPYSFTRAGQPWFAWEWGSDVLMGAAHQAAGLSGVAMFYGLAIAAGVWLWFRLHWIAGGNFLLACGLTAPMLTTANIHWLARPHVLSWLFLLGALWYAEAAKGRRSFQIRDVMLVGGFSVLWANVHASFFLAAVIALIYSVAYAVRPLIWDLETEPERRTARWFLCAAGVSAGASLINPYGWELHRHVFRYLSDAELLKRIGEFQSFDFHAEGAGQILLTMAIAMLGGVTALGQKKLAHFFLAALVVAASLRSARALPLVGLLILPLANGAITQALRECRSLQPGLRQRLDRFLEYSARLRSLDSGFSGIALAPIAALALFALLLTPGIAARTGFPADQFPVAAAAQVERLPESARILAPDKFGGYLIYRFNGKRKVFFDGRSDLYGAEFLKNYARLVQVRPGWREQLESFGFTHALLPNDYSLVPALEAIGWRRIYRDNVATLLEGPRC